MLFNSAHFLCFFPLVTFLYFALPRVHRWKWLLAASVYFYGVFLPEYLWVLAAIILVDFGAALKIEASSSRRKRYWLAASLVANLGLLFYFKYAGLAAKSAVWLAAALGSVWSIPPLEIILPVGLSFHTFQAMAYTIEVYRGRQPAERHLGYYSLYVLFFPQLVAGPIERPQNLLPQFHRSREFDATRAISGLRLMLWGLFKKVVIADRIGLLVDKVYEDPHGAGAPLLVLATMGFAIQIYGDFSGYSDMAIGAARILGFDFSLNFRRPYLARNLREFWNRWHISLSTWFRDYVYIPLGGNRQGWIRAQACILLTFALSGLWHGASVGFLIWGLVHGLLLVSENLYRRLRPDGAGSTAGADRLRRIRTFLFVSFAWIFFRANWQDGIYIVRTVFFDASAWAWPTFVRQLTERDLFYAAGNALIAGLSLLALESAYEFAPVDRWFQTRARAVRWGVYYAGILMVMFLGVLSSQRFIYFQF